MPSDNARSTGSHQKTATGAPCRVLGTFLLKEETDMETHRQDGSWPWVPGSVSGVLGLVLDPCPAMVRPGQGATIPDSRSQCTGYDF